MSPKPHDTTQSAWDVQSDALRRLGPEGRLRVALELSEGVRTIHLSGILARNPGLDEAAAVRDLVRRRFGIALPEEP